MSLLLLVRHDQQWISDQNRSNLQHRKRVSDYCPALWAAQYEWPCNFFFSQTCRYLLWCLLIESGFHNLFSVSLNQVYYSRSSESFEVVQLSRAVEVATCASYQLELTVTNEMHWSVFTPFFTLWTHVPSGALQISVSRVSTLFIRLWYAIHLIFK